MNYLLAIISILITCITFAVITIYIDNVLALSSENTYRGWNDFYESIRTIFIIGGITFVVQQYYVILKSNKKDYSILLALGATKHNIRTLIISQVITIIILTIPVGFFSGFITSNMIMSRIDDFVLGVDRWKQLDVNFICYMISGVICCFVIFIGAYVERDIWHAPLSCIFSDRHVGGKEVEELW